MPRSSGPDRNDPRLVDFASGERWNKLLAQHQQQTGESLKDVAKAVGIGVDNLYAYRRGHSRPSAGTEVKLMRHLTGGSAPVGVQTTKHIDGDFLVITTRVPLGEISL